MPNHGMRTTLLAPDLETGLVPNSSANSEELLEANPYTEKEGFEPSIEAKWLVHWPVLQRPTSASGRRALNGAF